MTQSLFFGNALASGSSFNVKRKMDDGDSDDEGGNQPSRMRSPPLKRRATFERPTPLPELMTDCSNSASNSDEDVAMDQDGDADMDRMDAYPQAQHQELDDRAFVPHYDYEYGMSGSGGIGFGPGAEEDGEMMEELMAEKAFSTYPSYTPHTNPNHFSNVPPYTSNTSMQLNGGRATSPLNAQPFTTSLRAPAGVFQPASAGPVSWDASAIEKARAVHGPQCKSIPKLQISPYPDPATGKQAMYTLCPDCGSCERAA